MSVIRNIKTLIRKIFKIENIGIRVYLFRLKRKIYKKVYRKKYFADDVVQILKKCGIKKGDNLCIHCCWGSLFNCVDNPEILINKILELIGEEGNIIVPTFNSKDIKIFDVNNTPSQGGYFSEVFRNIPGVKRSINIVSSVCAYGPKAEWLTKDHYLSEKTWDEYSPYYKFYKLGGIVIEIGLFKKISRMTLLHCPTCVENKEIKFFDKVMNRKIEYEYIDDEGKTYKKVEYTKNNKVRQNIKKLMKYYKFDCKQEKMQNVYFTAINSKVLYNKAVKLAKQGKFIYKLKH